MRSDFFPFSLIQYSWANLEVTEKVKVILRGHIQSYTSRTILHWGLHCILEFNGAPCIHFSVGTLPFVIQVVHFIKMAAPEMNELEKAQALIPTNKEAAIGILHNIGKN